MARDDFDWIDDAFDDKRTAEDMKKSGMSTPVGCIVGAVAILLIVAFVLVAAFSAMGLLGELATM